MHRGTGSCSSSMPLPHFVGFAHDVKLVDERLSEPQLAEIFANAMASQDSVEVGGGEGGEGEAMGEAEFEHALGQISARKGIGIMPLLGMLMSKAFSLQLSQANAQAQAAAAAAASAAGPGPGGC